MTTLGRTVAVAALLAAAGLGGCKGPPDNGPPTVTINGKSWQVESAITQKQRAQGLAGRTNLPQGRGMLFVFHRPDVRQFWMQGCLIPLDIAFINSDHRVIKTHTMTVEPGGQGRQLYSSQRPALYALEVPAGDLARAGVREGDLVVLLGDIPMPAKAEGEPGR